MAHSIINHSTSSINMLYNLPFTIWDCHILSNLDVETLLTFRNFLLEEITRIRCNSVATGQVETSKLRSKFSQKINHEMQYFTPHFFQSQNPTSQHLYNKYVDLVQQIERKYLIQAMRNSTFSQIIHAVSSVKKLAASNRFFHADFCSKNKSKKSLEILVVENIFKLLNFSPEKLKILFANFVGFVSTLPEKVGMIYLSEGKVVLPDNYLQPISETKFQDMIAELLKTPKIMYIVSCLMKVLLMEINSSHIQMRFLKSEKLRILVTNHENNYGFSISNSAPTVPDTLPLLGNHAIPVTQVRAATDNLNQNFNAARHAINQNLNSINPIGFSPSDSGFLDETQVQHELNDSLSQIQEDEFLEDQQEQINEITEILSYTPLDDQTYYDDTISFHNSLIWSRLRLILEIEF